MSDVSGSRDAKTPATPPARVERASDEVEQHPGAAPRLPGARREGYTKLPTGPVGIEPVVVSGPDIDAPGEAEWEPTTGAIPVDDTRLAPWALLAAIVALGASFFVGWGIPVAVVAVIAAIMSLRRPLESRAIALWALVLGLCATVYSLGWLVWAGMQFEKLG
ncbi:hypothetical protein HCX50_14140 [Microbacterium oxydans]|uniref:hypothetical protein n=1 Tax=unclassified Microbacterium TaxID=2609290 RepID=UPI00143044BE|nr:MULTISPECIES: hypothetical protein [unclassified Microbacterium]MBT2494954.1 hypothetical protein [Microbacterium sp. ISL-59]NJI60571.1 hypothetical protein [Microbacterium sp. B19(2022)]